MLEYNREKLKEVRGVIDAMLSEKADMDICRISLSDDSRPGLNPNSEQREVKVFIELRSVTEIK